MSDCFAILSLPPRAALDNETLQQAYLTAARQAHPDQGQERCDHEAAADLNTALETLRAPEKRLRHLLDHHSGGVPWRTVPLDNNTMALFEKLGPLLQQTGAFLKRKQAASSALAKALLAPQEMQLREALEDLAQLIDQRQSELNDTLPACDERIADGDPAVWNDLPILQSQFAYLAKWQTQLREALLQLML